MDVPSTAISTLSLAQSLIPERKSTSERRRELYYSVASQRISFTPEVGEPIELHLRNCTFSEDEKLTFLTVAVNDPNRPEDLFELETDFRYHYLKIYFYRPQERGHPLVNMLNFIEIGPEDFIVELGVDSVDPPTLQVAFERIERALAGVHTEYHQFLRSQYEQYKNEIQVTDTFEPGDSIGGCRTKYEVDTELEAEELVPSPVEDGFKLSMIGGDVDYLQSLGVGHDILDFAKWAAKAEASDGDCFALKRP